MSMGVRKSQWIVRTCMVRSPHIKKRLEIFQAFGRLEMNAIAAK